MNVNQVSFTIMIIVLSVRSGLPQKVEREFAYHTDNTDNTNTGIPFHNYDYRKIITHVHCFTT